MNTDIIRKILDAEPQVKSVENNLCEFGEELEVTVLFDLGHEILTINRVRKLSFLPDFRMVETYKGERFYIGLDAPLRGIKFAEPETKKVRGAGFAMHGN